MFSSLNIFYEYFTYNNTDNVPRVIDLSKTTVLEELYRIYNYTRAEGCIYGGHILLSDDKMAACGKDHITLFDLHTKKIIGQYSLNLPITNNGYISPIVLLSLPNGHLVIGCSGYHRSEKLWPSILIWDPKTQKTIHSLSGHRTGYSKPNTNYPQPYPRGGYIYDLVMIDNNHFASAADDGMVHIWDFNGNCTQTIDVSSKTNDAVYSLAVLPQGKLATAGEDNIIRVWNIGNGQCEKVLMGHSALISKQCLKVANGWLLSGGTDYTVRVWDPKTGKCLRVMDYQEALPCGRDYQICDLKVLSENSLMICTNNAFIIWDFKTGIMLSKYFLGDYPFGKDLHFCCTVLKLADNKIMFCAAGEYWQGFVYTLNTRSTTNSEINSLLSYANSANKNCIRIIKHLNLSGIKLDAYSIQYLEKFVERHVVHSIDLKDTEMSPEDQQKVFKHCKDKSLVVTPTSTMLLEELNKIKEQLKKSEEMIVKQQRDLENEQKHVHSVEEELQHQREIDEKQAHQIQSLIEENNKRQGNDQKQTQQVEQLLQEKQTLERELLELGNTYRNFMENVKLSPPAVIKSLAKQAQEATSTDDIDELIPELMDEKQEIHGLSFIRWSEYDEIVTISSSLIARGAIVNVAQLYQITTGNVLETLLQDIDLSQRRPYLRRLQYGILQLAQDYKKNNLPSTQVQQLNQLIEGVLIEQIEQNNNPVDNSAEADLQEQYHLALSKIKEQEIDDFFASDNDNVELQESFKNAMKEVSKLPKYKHYNKYLLDGEILLDKKLRNDIRTKNPQIQPLISAIKFHFELTDTPQRKTAAIKAVLAQQSKPAGIQTLIDNQIYALLTKMERQLKRNASLLSPLGAFVSISPGKNTLSNNSHSAFQPTLFKPQNKNRFNIEKRQMNPVLQYHSLVGDKRGNTNQNVRTEIAEFSF